MTGDRLAIALIPVLIGLPLWLLHDDLVEVATLAPSAHEPDGELHCEWSEGRPYLDVLAEMHAGGWTTATTTVDRMMKHEPLEPFDGCHEDAPMLRLWVPKGPS